MEYLNEEGLVALWDDTKEYVEKYHGENSGEKESDGTEAGPISELTAKGHAEQFTTTGKNLLSPTPRTSGIMTAYADGRVVFNGTVSDSGQQWSLKPQNVPIPEGTYTLSVRSESAGFTVRASGGGVSSQSVTFTSNGTWNQQQLIINVQSGTYSNAVAYVQLELGSTATSYEPYTGGAPSPSPDYPQEIQVARGRNLFDPASATLNGYIGSGATLVADNSNIGAVLEVEPNTTYTLQGTIVNTGSVADNWHIAEFAAFPSAGATAIMAKTIDVNLNLTFTTSANTRYLFIKYCNVTRSNPAVTRQTIQLERGSVATPYVPYGHVGLEVRSKKNMLEVNDVVVRGNNYTQMFREPITLNGKYVLSASVTSNDTNAQTCAALLRYANGTTSATLQFNRGSRYSIVINFNNDATLSGITFYSSDNYSNGTGDTAIWSDIQLEVGDVMTDFEKGLSTTPIPLPSRGWVAGLPDGTSDTLTLDGAGKVVWEKKTDINTLNITGGTAAGEFDNVNGFSIYGNIRAWGLLDADIARNHYPMYASHLMSVTVNNSNFTNVILKGSGSVLVINIAGATSVSEAREAVNALGCEVLYPLATPVTEDMGYVDGWTNDFPEGCVLSIPELDDLGVKYHVDGVAATLAHQWYERARSEYEDRITSLESTVAMLVAGS